ncbi:hypothetical protein FJZ18_01865 [Candidatus Pacearchaeota archaeon]|nr:hypothetical protein [Candidatus Pacearchaeota archaeon]
MTRTIEKTFKFLNIRDSCLTIEISDELFMPNQTTAAVAESVRVSSGDIGIELGAGIGPISIILASNPLLTHLYTTEIVEDQWSLAKKNLAKYRLENKVTPYNGDLFEPIRQNHPGLEVDFIVSDISGMAEEPARKLGWYPTHIPSGGTDGTDKIVPLIVQSGEFLKTSGRLYFPIVVNFSDGDKILAAAHKYFDRIERVKRTSLPLSKELCAVVLSLSSGLYENLEPRGSRGLWHLDTYVAEEPKQN